MQSLVLVAFIVFELIKVFRAVGKIDPSPDYIGLKWKIHLLWFSFFSNAIPTSIESSVGE